MQYIKTEVLNGTGFITLDNPKKRNALGNGMSLEIAAALEDFKKQDLLTVVIRADVNAKVWSAGHDIAELPRGGVDPLAYDTPLEQMLRAIELYPGVVLAQVSGSAWGGACGLAMTCDMIVADETASFAITPIKIGLPYNPAGIVQYCNRLGAGLTKELFFTARTVSAERAHAIGVIHHFVKKAEIGAYTAALAAEINGYAPLAVKVVKEQMRLLFRDTPISHDALERIAQLRRDTYCSEDYHEGLKAFAEKRKPVFKGK